MRLADCFNDIFSFTTSFLDLCQKDEEPALLRSSERNDLSGTAPNIPAGIAGILTPKSFGAQQPTPAAPALQAIQLERVRDTYCRLFAASSDLANRHNFSENDYRLAKFAVCAWVDERIVSSNLPQCLQWHTMELQRIYFQTTNAGEEFFTCLVSLKPNQSAVLEVFSLCLSLGFQGKYYGSFQNEELTALKRVVARGVLGRSPELSNAQGATMLAQAYPGQEGPGATRSGDVAAKLAVAAVPVVIFIVMFLLYNSFLNNFMQSFFQ